ncbi:MAG: arylsulfatase [Pseudomonadota bacterium]
MSFTRREFLKASATVGALSAIPASRTESRSLIEPDPDWRRRHGARKPNIIVVVLDDVGFADLGCYGSELDTPSVDELAAAGVRFNNFHVTALCAPTRACLLTGRNAHAVGVGNIAEWGRADHPGYRGWIRQDAMTLAEMLKADDYSTYAIGKWHLSSLDDQNGTGPFHRWPTQRGFDRWYGFHGNAMDHWHPEMFENTSPVYPDKSGDYHLSTDLVDNSIRYVADHIAAAPDNPFFLYLAFGAMHFPLHAPQSDIDRHKGKYDTGWDVVRSERFKRQLESGLVPPNTKLPENPDVPDWDSLGDGERRLATRSQEVYAAFLEHTDAQLSRLIEFLKSENQFDDTLIMVLSDNGAAPGGPVYGSVDVRRDAYLGRPPIEDSLANIDDLGSDASYCGAARGWAQVSNTPLKWYKSDTYEGGIRSPLVVSWPNGEIPAGQINSQYHHVIDIVPTLLTMSATAMPNNFRGDAPLPLQGTSFAYTFDDPEAATRKTVQYYETMGDRAIWQNGWKAVARHTPGADFADDEWQLFHAANDFSEIENLADVHPARLAGLVKLWHEEAERYDVLPMADNALQLYENAVPLPRATYVFYPGMTRLDRLSAPDIYAYDTDMLADIEVGSGTVSGVLLASGDSGGGYEWFVRDNKVVFVYVYTRNEIYRVAGNLNLNEGRHTLGLRVRKTGESSAQVVLTANDSSVAELTLPNMWPIYAPNSGVRCGENRHAPISRDYEPPFTFRTALKRIVVDVDVPQL